MGRNELEAEQVAEFVESNLANMEYLICQCEMRQSRSAAVAAAIIEDYTGIPPGIFDDIRCHPNELVYIAPSWKRSPHFDEPDGVRYRISGA